MQDEILKDAAPRVFVFTPEDEAAVERVLVLAKGLWYERIEGETGAVEFLHIADDDQELREKLAGIAADFDIDEANEDLAGEVEREFLEQTPLYPEAPELSDQWN